MRLVESIEDRGILKAIFLAGPPGAGKTTTLAKLQTGQHGLRVVDPDIFVRRLAKKGRIDLSDPSTQNDDIMSEVKELKAKQVANYINSMLPIVVDGTAAKAATTITRAEILESFGYDTMMVWIGTDLETAKTNAMQRDRQVPMEVIEQNYAILEYQMATYKMFFGKNFIIHENTFITDKEMFEYRRLMELSRLGVISDDDHRRELMATLEEKFNASISSEFSLKETKAKVGRFLDSPVRNGRGTSFIKALRENGEKYLTPSIISGEALLRITRNWDRRPDLRINT